MIDIINVLKTGKVDWCSQEQINQTEVENRLPSKVEFNAGAATIEKSLAGFVCPF